MITGVREDVQTPGSAWDKPRKRSFTWSLEGPTGVWRGGKEEREILGGGSRVDEESG